MLRLHPHVAAARRSRIPCLLLVLALAPGLGAATYDVGSGKAYPTLASLPQLAPGDTVTIHPGTYNEVKRWTDAGSAAAQIIIQGVGDPRPIIDATGITVDGSLPNPRAVMQVEASHVRISHLTLQNARNGDDGSGIRVTSFGATTTDVTISDCLIQDNDMGVMSDTMDDLTLSACEIANNGTSASAGYSHNLYLGGGSTTVIGCWIHDALDGQNVKSRGHFTALLYNLIENSQDGEVGLVDSADTATPQSNAVLLGNLIISKPRGSGWNSMRFIQWGEDLGGDHPGTMYVLHNTCIAGTTSIDFLWTDLADSAIVADGNLFVGSDQIATGETGPVTGAANWMPSTATDPSGFTGSVLAADPGFVDAADGNYLLTAGSSARGIVPSGLTYLDGAGVSQSGDPTQQWQSLGTLVARSSPVDAGAFGDPGASTTAGTTTGTGTTTGPSGTTTATSGTGTSGTTTATGSGSGGTTTSAGATSGATTVVGTGGGSSGGCGVGGALGLIAIAALQLVRRRGAAGRASSP